MTKVINNPKLRHFNLHPDLTLRPDWFEEEYRRRQESVNQYVASIHKPSEAARPEDQFLSPKMGDEHRIIEEATTTMGVENVPYNKDIVPLDPPEVHREDPYYSGGGFPKVKVTQQYQLEDVRHTEEE